MLKPKSGGSLIQKHTVHLVGIATPNFMRLAFDLASAELESGAGIVRLWNVCMIDPMRKLLEGICDDQTKGIRSYGLVASRNGRMQSADLAGARSAGGWSAAGGQHRRPGCHVSATEAAVCSSSWRVLCRLASDFRPSYTTNVSARTLMVRERLAGSWGAMLGSCCAVRC